MTHSVGGLVSVVWLRWSDLNRRPLGCEASTCRGVTTRQTRPVRPQKCAPRRRPARRRRQPVVFQFLGDRASRDAVIEVPQRALDATVAPRWIVRGPPQNERRDLLHDPRTARPLPLERPLPGDQPPVPPQDRVGRHDGRHSPQDPATESLALRREASAMVVGQPDASAFHLLFEDTVLSAKYSRTSYWWRFTHPASHEQ